MSQWGRPAMFEGCEVVPHVRGLPFERISARQFIDDMVITNINLGGDFVAAEKKARSFIGNPYAEWPA